MPRGRRRLRHASGSAANIALTPMLAACAPFLPSRPTLPIPDNRPLLIGQEALNGMGSGLSFQQVDPYPSPAYPLVEALRDWIDGQFGADAK